MATLKVVLDTRKTKKDGKYLVKIRVTHHRKSWYYPIDIYILEKYWDASKERVKRQYPNAKLLNLKIRDTYTQVETQLLELERSNPNYTLNDIKNLFTEQEPEIPTTVFSFADDIIQQMKQAKRIGNAQSYTNGIVKLKEYVGGKEAFSFEEIDYNFLCEWEANLLGGGLKVNSVAAYFKAIRAIYNRAIKAGIVDRNLYPFDEYRIRTEKTVNRALSKEQIQLIEGLDLAPDTAISRARDYFMLSFYLIGINFRDLAFLTIENLHKDRIIYKRAKTGKIYSVKLLPQAKLLFDKYHEVNSSFLLPIISSKYSGDLEKQVKVAKEAVKNVNSRHLRKIAVMLDFKEQLTTYYARYSWANIAKKLGYSKDLIAEALGHEYGNKVTGIYLDNYDKELIDEANEKVTVD
ncbi:MAG: site-specific integrase [Chitinophagales bacterium]